MLIKCDDHGWATTDLLFQPTGSNDIIDLHVDNKKIKLASKNVYNITHLTYNDSGEYICYIITLNTSEKAAAEITRHELLVLKEGKTCMDRMADFLLDIFCVWTYNQSSITLFVKYKEGMNIIKQFLGEQIN